MTLLVAVVLAALGGWSALTAPTSVGFQAMLDAEHPAVHELEEFSDQFTGAQPVVLAWSCEVATDPCKSVFDSDSLRMALIIGDRLKHLEEVSRVSSPAHTPLLIASGEDLVQHWFFSDGVLNAPTDLVEQALTDPLWRGGLVSTDGRVGALIVEPATFDTKAHERIIESIERATEEFRGDGFRFALSGIPWIGVAAYRGMAEDGMLLGLATIAVISVCFAALLQSWQSVLGVVATVGLATGASLVVVRIFSWPWDPIASGAPTLVLVVGSADAIHFLTVYWHLRSRSHPVNDGLYLAAHETSSPCAMTTATAMVGLLSFVSTDAVAISHFGAIAAAGVLASLLFTFSVLPVALALLPDQPRFAVRESARWDGIIERLVEFPIRRRIGVLGLAALATGIGGLGLTQLTTEADLVGYWKAGDPTREGIEFVSRRLASVDSVEIQLTSPTPLEAGESLAELRELERSLRALENVREVRSAFSILDRVAHTLGASSFDSVNAGEVLTAIALGDSTVADGWVSLDHRTVRVSVSAHPLEKGERRLLVSAIETAVKDLPSDWRAVVTGPSVLQRTVEELLADAALQSVSASSLLVSVLVMVFLRSVRWGALAMIPNLVPMVILFGAMGILGMSLDAGAAVVAPIAIGIAVDDTIHFLHAYAAFRRAQRPSLDAVRHAAYRVGRAMVTTSGTLALGFLAMLASRFQSASNIGTLSAIAIASAFAAELLVLPALIATFRGKLDSKPLRTQEVTW
jgi:predicted RND superfamily exporter protein